MKKLPIVLISAIVILLSPDGWSFPLCSDTPANSLEETKGWDKCFGRLYFQTGRFKGDKYIGEFKGGKGHGLGTYMWIYKEKYVGEFKDGVAHGEGTFTDSNGTVFMGIFENGKYLNLKKP